MRSPLRALLLVALASVCCASFAAAQATGASQPEPTNVGQIDSNAFLSVLSFSVGTLIPPFDPSQTSYTLLMGIGQGRTRLNMAMQDPEGGSAYFAQGSSPAVWRDDPANFEIYFDEGVTPYTITTWGKNQGAKIVYQILIYRPPTISSANANLVNFTFSSGTLSPSNFSSRTLTYDVLLGNTTPPFQEMVATPADLNAYIEIRVDAANARTMTAGRPHRIAFDTSVQQVRISVISQNARVVNVYTFNFKRGPPGGFTEHTDASSTGSTQQLPVTDTPAGDASTGTGATTPLPPPPVAASTGGQPGLPPPTDGQPSSANGQLSSTGGQQSVGTTDQLGGAVAGAQPLATLAALTALFALAAAQPRL